MEVVVPCDCGSRFSFEVEPVDGRLPAGAELLCPTCNKDGVPLANRVIGETLRKAAAAQAKLEAAMPKKKSFFGRSSDKTKAVVAEPAPYHDPFANARASDNDEIYAGPNKVKGMLGALIGGIVGAATWAIMVYVTGYEIRYVAVGVGALVGLCSRKFGGGRDYHLGLFATACALLAILVGQWFAANAYIKQFAAEFAAEQYKSQVEFAQELDSAKTDEDYKEFIAFRNSTLLKPVLPVTIKDEAVAVFKKNELPALQKLAAGDPPQDAYVKRESEAYLKTLGVKDIFVASITPYLFLWVFLGIGAAWKLASDYGTSVE